MQTLLKHFDEGKDTSYRTSDEIFNECLKNKVDVRDLSRLAPVPINVDGAGSVYETVRDKCYHHFTAFYSGTADFKYYESAYRFGVELANAPQYADKLWADIEAEIAIMWDNSNPATWDIHHSQIMHGWNVGQQARMMKVQQTLR